uniref:Uncharacterized protein n=1 Tax=Steinernema glaseri TaxID=37863 RepID=A0A1I7Z0D6_9BILA
MKAREILLDPPGGSTVQEQQAKLVAKTDSDGDMRRTFLKGILRRSDSQSTQNSRASYRTESTDSDPNA